jgi:flagellar biosynthesis protein FlhG
MPQQPPNRDQADELRYLVRAHARRTAPTDAAPRMIVVTGGQRALGTTTIALNLTVALVQQGQRAVLVDADFDRGSVAALCGIPERGSIVDVLSARHTIHEVLARGPAGIQVLPGVWAPTEAAACPPTAQGRLIAQLKGLGAHAEVIVVDAGCGRNSFVRRFWQAADVALVVTTPAPAAIMDCYATIKVLLAGESSTTVRTIVNRAHDAAGAAEVQARIAAACRRFLGVQANAVGHIPEDPTMQELAPLPLPFLLSSPRSEAARAIERLSERLWLEAQTNDAAAPGAAPAAGGSEPLAA